MPAINHRYDFVYLFDVANGNPNRDPDAGNMPRLDAETGLGLVTDVCLKRKVRNFVSLACGADPGFRIYMAERAVLNLQHREAYAATGLTPEAKKLPKKEEEARSLTKWMCDNFYDIRAFGAVMSTEVNVGQVREPLGVVAVRFHTDGAAFHGPGPPDPPGCGRLHRAPTATESARRRGEKTIRTRRGQRARRARCRP
jgi:Cas7 group CRISPR-associated protein Csh2